MSSDTWAQISDPATTIDLWRSAPTVQLVLSVPMWPTTGGGSLAAAANGDYNDYFASLARALVAAHRSATILRIGWEFNTSFYPWAVTSPASAALYAEAWRQIVTAIRSAAGQHFGFVWTPNGQPGGLDPALSYPGDGYVSDVGLDVYDQDQTLGQSPQARWSDLVGKGYGLAWQAKFATAHSKPIAFPEWGEELSTTSPGLGGGDNPYFITQMRRWFAAHHTAFEDYFNSDTNYGTFYALDGGSDKFPRSAATYRSLWSGATSP
jgi:beta-mannanase